MNKLESWYYLVQFANNGTIAYEKRFWAGDAIGIIPINYYTIINKLIDNNYNLPKRKTFRCANNFGNNLKGVIKLVYS